MVYCSAILYIYDTIVWHNITFIWICQSWVWICCFNCFSSCYHLQLSSLNGRIIAGWMLNSQVEIQMQCPVAPETMPKLSHCLSGELPFHRCLVELRWSGWLEHVDSQMTKHVQHVYGDIQWNVTKGSATMPHRDETTWLHSTFLPDLSFNPHSYALYVSAIIDIYLNVIIQTCHLFLCFSLHVAMIRIYSL